MNHRATSKKIDDTAALWVARIDRGPISAEEQFQLDEWLAADPRHLGAFARAGAVSIHLERARALGKRFDPASFADGTSTNWLTRRRALYLGSAAAAAVAAVAVVPALIPNSNNRRIATELGQVSRVPLADGSVITLNTASEVMVSYTRRQRTVRLVRGEALFDVARDPRRPFIVIAGVATVRAIGTSFAIVLLPQQISVVIREGIVEVNRVSDSEPHAVRLPANMRAVVPADAAITALPVSSEDVDRQLIWREGRIAFEGSSLAEAAAAFARYSQTRILFSDPTIARETITGLFVADDPVGFSKAVAISLGLHLRIGENQVELSR